MAINGEEVRTQCHTHIHIGKLIKGADIETKNFIVISRPDQIPDPKGLGLWIHPVGNKMHVHMGEQTGGNGTIQVTPLLEITKLPTAENSAIHLHPPDNVAIARVPLSAGPNASRWMDARSLCARRHPRRP